MDAKHMCLGKVSKAIPLKRIVPSLSCPICKGFLVDAISLLDCNHSFCRSCFFEYIESNDTCPACGIFVNRNRLENCIKNDEMLQSLSYRLVPGLLTAELRDRENLYEELHRLTVSKKSLEHIVGEKEITNENKKLLPLKDKYFGLIPKLCAPNDPISIGFEFPIPKEYFKNGGCMKAHDVRVETLSRSFNGKVNSAKCYFVTPARTRVGTLKKLLMTKYLLFPPSDIEIVYGGEILGDDYSLSDILHIFLGGVKKYLHFYFQVASPIRLRVAMPKLKPQVKARNRRFFMIPQKSNGIEESEEMINEIPSRVV